MMHATARRAYGCAAAGLIAGLCMATAVTAQESSNRVAAKTDWSIFVEDNPKQCWVVSAPTENIARRDGRVVAVRRGDIYLFVSFWPDSAEMGQVSFLGGYPFREGSAVELKIGDSEFQLITDGETAWAATPEDDRRIAAAMKRGAEAMVVGVSQRGTQTTDRFSLMGFTAAIEDAEKRCSG
ncbi:MAG: invasion associated locus B family protein [Rhodobacteraceae bacterium]|nr:invasion associated locus B family protein [Paracoccaceae bacterium]